MKYLYGIMVISLLWYTEFRKDLEKERFKFNSYEICAENRKLNGKQHIVRFHLNNLMIRHADKKVNNKFDECLN